MADENLRAEIESLRAQLSTLKSEREASAKSSEPDSETPSDEEPVDAAVEATPGAESEGQHDLAAQFHELLDSLDKDLRETKPSVLLIVFALGVLIGRLGR